METNNSTEIREHIRNESPTYKKFGNKILNTIYEEK